MANIELLEGTFEQDDKELISDLLETFTTSGADKFPCSYCEAITNLYYMIAVLWNGIDIAGFRLYDLRYDTTADYTYDSVAQRVREKTVHIANLAWISITKDTEPQLACIEGQFEDYTRLSSGGIPLSTYRPLVFIGYYGYDGALFVDYKGGVHREAFARNNSCMSLATVGVANLLFTAPCCEAATLTKLSRYKSVNKPIFDIGRSIKNVSLCLPYAEDIYTSEQSCDDVAVRSSFRLRTMIIKDDNFAEAALSLFDINCHSSDIKRDANMLPDEPLFLDIQLKLLSGEREEIDYSSSRNGIFASHPTVSSDVLVQFYSKAVPLVTARDMTAWENFAAFTQLNANGQFTYLPAARAAGNPNYARCVAIEDTDVVSIPESLAVVALLTESNTSQLLNVMMRGTTAVVTEQGDREWVLNFQATSAVAFFQIKSPKTKLMAIHITGELETVLSYSFMDLRSVKEVELPDTVYLLGMYCFENCSSLRDIHLPAQLKGIGAGAFKSCTQLQITELPEGLLVIGAYAFTGDISIKTLVIPASVRVIHRKAFADCSGITNIVIKGTPKIEVTAFDGCSPTVCAIVSEFETFNELKDTAKKLKKE